MKSSCNYPACIYCNKYNDCKKRVIKECKCGNKPSTKFKLISKNRKIKRIDVVVECSYCKRETPVFKYEFEAIKAWNKGDIK